MTKSALFKNMLRLSLLFSVLTTSCTPLGEKDAGTYEEKLYANSEYWGLGKKIEKYVSNNRDYEWYIDQLNTGPYWDANCGPTSVEMAGRYYDPNFAHSAEEARELYLNDGGWWFDHNIRDSLEIFDVEFDYVFVTSGEVMKEAIDDGNILLINPSMEYITMEEKSHHRVGLYVPPGTGHYIIVKGYVVADGNTFYEVYDPWSVGLTYKDGQLKGKDRYYDETSLLSSLWNWYSKAYTINKMVETIA